MKPAVRKCCAGKKSALARRRRTRRACVTQAVGLNFIDVYFRTGRYPLALPCGIGLEGAGVVEAVGSAVTEVKVGDRVAYAGGPPGAYAEVRNIPADRLVKLPDSIDFKTAAAMMLQGMTAQYLLRRTYRVQAGDTILIQAAAGGVGLIVCQWAKALGATVIGTVSSDEKAALAQGAWLRPSDHLHARELRRARQGNHRRRRACRSSMTRSAPILSRNRSTACGRWA